MHFSGLATYVLRRNKRKHQTQTSDLFSSLLILLPGYLVQDRGLKYPLLIQDNKSDIQFRILSELHIHRSLNSLGYFQCKVQLASQTPAFHVPREKKQQINTHPLLTLLSLKQLLFILLEILGVCNRTDTDMDGRTHTL